MTVSRRRLVAPLAAILALVPLAFAAPASAANTAEDDKVAAQNEYATLTSALMSMYANDAGLTLASYLDTNNFMVQAAGRGGTISPTGEMVAALTMGTGSSEGTKLTGSDTKALDTELMRAGLALDTRNYTSLQSMAADVIAKSHTADGAVTLAGAEFVSRLGGIRTPELTMPTVPGATMPGIPSDALPFGLLMNEALAGTVLNAPDLFAAAAKSGVGSEALSAAFSEQMREAWSKSNQSITAALPNPCTGQMMAVMATGNQASAKDYQGCNPACVTGGLYLNAQVQRIFAPADKQLSVNYDDTSWSYEAFIQMTPSQRQLILQNNPGLVREMLNDDGSAGGARFCDSAALSTEAVLQEGLTGIFGTLRAKR